MTEAEVLMAVVVVVTAFFAYWTGYLRGITETERRWSEAVERKKAHDEADRQNEGAL